MIQYINDGLDLLDRIGGYVLLLLVITIGLEYLTN
jgi:hypothetical protein